MANKTKKKFKEKKIFKTQYLLFFFFVFLFGLLFFYKDLVVSNLPLMQVPHEAHQRHFVKNSEALWLDNGQYFALASEHCVYYKQANKKFPIKSLQKRLRRVQLTKLENEQHMWFFVCDLEGNPLGWIKKEQVSFKNDFEVVKFWTAGNFEIKNGRKIFSFKVKHKGYIELNWQDKSGGIYTKGKQKGQLYENGYLLWAKIWKPYVAHYFFYMDNQSQIFSEEAL